MAALMQFGCMEDVDLIEQQRCADACETLARCELPLEGFRNCKQRCEVTEFLAQQQFIACASGFSQYGITCGSPGALQCSDVASCMRITYGDATMDRWGIWVRAVAGAAPQREENRASDGAPCTRPLCGGLSCLDDPVVEEGDSGTGESSAGTFPAQPLPQCDRSQCEGAVPTPPPATDLCQRLGIDAVWFGHEQSLAPAASPEMDCPTALGELAPFEVYPGRPDFYVSARGRLPDDIRPSDGPADFCWTLGVVKSAIEAPGVTVEVPIPTASELLVAPEENEPCRAGPNPAR